MEKPFRKNVQLVKMDDEKRDYIDKTIKEWSLSYKEADRWQQAIDVLKDQVNEYEGKYQEYQRREYEANKALKATIDELDGEDLQEARSIVEPYITDIAMANAGFGDVFVDAPTEKEVG